MRTFFLIIAASFSLGKSSCQNTVSSDSAQLQCNVCRQILYSDTGFIDVIIRINASSLQGIKAGTYAKVQESIPQGAICDFPVKTNAIATAKGSAVKFLWMSFPLSNSEVRYRIKLPEIAGTFVISGVFSFVDDQTQIITIPITGDSLIHFR